MGRTFDLPIQVTICTSSCRGVLTRHILTACLYLEVSVCGTLCPCVQVLGTQVEVHGDMQFIGNGRGALNAGAVYLTSLAQIKLFGGATFLFEGNTGV